MTGAMTGDVMRLAMLLSLARGFGGKLISVDGRQAAASPFCVGCIAMHPDTVSDAYLLFFEAAAFDAAGFLGRVQPFPRLPDRPDGSSVFVLLDVFHPFLGIFL